jgi:hypothetical protein
VTVDQALVRARRAISGKQMAANAMPVLYTFSTAVKTAGGTKWTLLTIAVST